MKFLIALFLISSHICFAQGTSKVFAERMTEEENFQARLSAALPWKERYRYDEFKEGRIFYTTHKESDITLMNYHLKFQEMLMITETGDTTLIANFELAKFVMIDKDLYYHDLKNGYFEILSNPNDSIQLTSQWHLKTTRVILDGVEKPKEVSNHNNFSFLYVPRNPSFSSERVTVYREPTFFVLDKKEEIHPASKAVFFKLFPEHKKAIENYISQMTRTEQRALFQNERELKELLRFCSSLR